MKTHELKTWPQYYVPLAEGKKTFEIRRNDREFAVGDALVLKEWNPDARSYTGRELRRVVTYIFPGGEFGLDSDYVVLGLGK